MLNEIFRIFPDFFLNIEKIDKKFQSQTKIFI